MSADEGEAGSLTLPTRLAAHIIDYAKCHDMPVGSHLREQALAGSVSILADQHMPFEKNGTTWPSCVDRP